MFFSRHNNRPSGRPQRPTRLPFRPILEALEERITPTTITPTSTSEMGALTLRDAVNMADGDSGVVTIQLQAGQTYTLSGSNGPLDFKNTNANTTIVLQGGPGTKIEESSGSSRVLQVENNTNVIIQDVTIEGGKALNNPTATEIPGTTLKPAAAGGGLLNAGGNVALTNVNFSTNSASAAGTTGGIAAGGAIYSTGGSLTLDTVTLNNNVAKGGPGLAAFMGPQTPGGEALGGAIADINSPLVVTNVAAQPGNFPPALTNAFTPPRSLTQPLLTVTNNKAQGGTGGNGINTTTAAHNGTLGGLGLGGGLWLDGGTVEIAAASMSDNTAQGGTGGNGNMANHNNTNLTGRGGEGGAAAGGAIETGGFINTTSTPPTTTITVLDSTFATNTAQGGTGGTGGTGVPASAPSTTNSGGSGGPGGPALGGGVAVLLNGDVLNMSNSTVANNSANGGAGGTGGSGRGGGGGNGGPGGPAVGGGLNVTGGASTSNLVNVTIAFNQIDNQSTSGNGGAGGTDTGSGGPGSGGSEGTADGAGINSDGSALLTNSIVADNQFVGGTSQANDPDVAGALNPGTSFTYFGNAANLQGTFGSNINYFANVNGVAGTPGFVTTQPTNSNGGPTPTIEISSSSFVVGKGSSGIAASASDQRGVSRGSSIDLGAVESTPASQSGLQISGTLTPSSTLSYVPTSGTAQTVTLNATVDNNGTAVSGGSVTFALLGPNNQPVSGFTPPTAAMLSNSGTTGNVTLTIPAGTTPGQYTIQATYTDTNNKQNSPVPVSGTTLTINPVQANLNLSNVNVTNQTVTVTATVAATAANGPTVNEGKVQFSLVSASSGATVTQTSSVNAGTTGSVTLGSNLAPGSYTLTATYTDSTGGFQSSMQSQTVNVPAPISPPPPVGGGGGGAGGVPPLPPPPVPPLTAIINLFIDGAEKIIQGDSAALEASIDANLPFATIAGFNIGSLVVLAGEIAANNALHGGGNS